MKNSWIRGILAITLSACMITGQAACLSAAQEDADSLSETGYPAVSVADEAGLEENSSSAAKEQAAGVNPEEETAEDTDRAANETVQDAGEDRAAKENVQGAGEDLQAGEAQAAVSGRPAGVSRYGLRSAGAKIVHHRVQSEDLPTGAEHVSKYVSPYYTAVNDQGLTGSCWAFGNSSAMEASLNKRYESEKHEISWKNLAYYAWHKNDLLTVRDGKDYAELVADESDLKSGGGYSCYAPGGGRGYSSTVNCVDKDVSYLFGGGFTYTAAILYSQDRCLMDDSGDNSLSGDLNDMDYILDNGGKIGSSAGDNYRISDAWVLSAEKSNADNIKLMLEKYGAGAISYYSSNSNGEAVYNSESEVAQIQRDYSGEDISDHTVTLVGWDDNYSASNFTGGGSGGGRGHWWFGPGEVIDGGYDDGYGGGYGSGYDDGYGSGYGGYDDGYGGGYGGYDDGYGGGYGGYDDGYGGGYGGRGESEQPPGDGAWICINSWGTGSDSGTDNGKIYISYYDASLTNSDVIFYDAYKKGDKNGEYLWSDNNYGVEGISDVLKKRSGDGAFGLIYKTDKDTTLSRISFFAGEDNTDYTLSIYGDPPVNNGYVSMKDNTPILTQDVSVDFGGIRSVKLKNSIGVRSGQSVLIVLKPKKSVNMLYSQTGESTESGIWDDNYYLGCPHYVSDASGLTLLEDGSSGQLCIMKDGDMLVRAFSDNGVKEGSLTFESGGFDISKMNNTSGESGETTKPSDKDSGSNGSYSCEIGSDRYEIRWTDTVAYTGYPHVLYGNTKKNATPDIKVSVYKNGTEIPAGQFKVKFKNNKFVNGYKGKNPELYVTLGKGQDKTAKKTLKKIPMLFNIRKASLSTDIDYEYMEVYLNKYGDGLTKCNGMRYKTTGTAVKYKLSKDGVTGDIIAKVRSSQNSVIVELEGINNCTGTTTQEFQDDYGDYGGYDDYWGYR